MYKLLIVDDEPDIVNYLHIIFSEWNKYDLEVYKAFSGNKALEILNKVKIDIVLTDMKMPGMSGIELLEKIKHDWPECRVIFLTGHKEFEYIYKVTRYDDVSYFLKTSSDEEIIDAVEKAIAYIESRLMDETILNKATEQLANALPLLQTEYITQLVYENNNASLIEQKRLDELEIPLNVSVPSYMLIGKFDKMTREMIYTEKTEYIFRIKSISEKFIPNWFETFHSVIENTYFIWLIQPHVEKAAINDYSVDNWFETKKQVEKISLIIKGAFETIQSSIEKTLNLTMSLAVNTYPIDFNKVNPTFLELRKIINSRIGSGTQMLLTEKNLPKSEDDGLIVINEKLQKVYLNIRSLQRLATYLELGQRDEYFSLLMPFVKAIEKEESLRSNIAIEIYYTISIILINYINKLKISTSIAFKIGIYQLSNVTEHSNWEEAGDYLIKLSDVLFDMQSEQQFKRAEDCITTIKQYIFNNLNDDLSLVRLADIVELNPSYLSRLFKQETGTNVSNYVNQKRLNKAKELIASTQLRINEISASLGFDTPTYFTRFFKKGVGMSPQRYRDINFKEKNQN